MLLSYLVCSIANVAIAFGFTAMYTTTQKTIRGHLKKHIHKHVMAIFVIIYETGITLPQKRK